MTEMPNRARPRFSAVTSIPPVKKSIAGEQSPRHSRNIPLAVKSFETNGFAVVSVNRGAEIEGLRPLYPTTTFVRSDGFDELFRGRYGPSFAAIFDACRRSDFCGIVNADVYMIASDIIAALLESPGSFFAARRSDVAGLGGDLIGTYHRGIDAVFFNSAHFAPLLDDAELGKLQLGAPFWDTIFPVVASFHGDVRFIAPPFILHPVHTANRSRPDYHLLRAVAVRAVYAHAKRHAPASDSARKFLSIVDSYIGPREELRRRREVKAVAQIIGAWLKRIEVGHSERIAIDVNDAIYKDTIAPLADEDMFTGSGRRGASLIRRVGSLPQHWRQAWRNKRIDALFAEADRKYPSTAYEKSEETARRN